MAVRVPATGRPFTAQPEVRSSDGAPLSPALVEQAPGRHRTVRFVAADRRKLLQEVEGGPRSHTLGIGHGARFLRLQPLLGAERGLHFPSEKHGWIGFTDRDICPPDAFPFAHIAGQCHVLREAEW